MTKNAFTQLPVSEKDTSGVNLCLPQGAQQLNTAKENRRADAFTSEPRDKPVVRGESEGDHDSQLSYQVSKSVVAKLRTLKRAVYWSHTFYRNGDGHPVKISYATTKEASELLAKKFLNKTVLGFDMEWKARNAYGIKDNISLIQLACEDEIALFHIALHSGTLVHELLAPTLQRILETPSITKTGVAILSADGNRLKKFMGLKPRGLFELSFLYRLVEHHATDPSKCNKVLVSLSDQVKKHLGFPLFKGDVRTSDWTKPLSEEQKSYAADDAYAGFMLYHSMESKRLRLDPLPPRPQHAELLLPIQLAEGIERVQSTEVKQFQTVETPKTGVADQPLGTKTKRAHSKSNKHTVNMDGLGVSIFNALRMRRTELAREKDLPAYMIAYDRVLASIARLRPNDMDSLKKVEGLGAKGILNYGSEWLRLVTEYVQETAVDSERVASTNITDAVEGAPTAWVRPIFRIPPSLPPLSEHMASPCVENEVPDTSAKSPIEKHDSFYSDPGAANKEEVECHNPSFERLFSALNALRRRLSKSTGKPFYVVASDATIKSLAISVPSTVGQICRIPGAGLLLIDAKKNNIDLLTFIQGHGLVPGDEAAPQAKTDIQPNNVPTRWPLAELDGVQRLNHASIGSDSGPPHKRPRMSPPEGAYLKEDDKSFTETLLDASKYS